MSFFTDVAILNIRNISLANTVARLCVRSDKHTGQHYINETCFATLRLLVAFSLIIPV